MFSLLSISKHTLNFASFRAAVFGLYLLYFLFVCLHNFAEFPKARVAFKLENREFCLLNKGKCEAQRHLTRDLFKKDIHLCNILQKLSLELFRCVNFTIPLF